MRKFIIAMVFLGLVGLLISCATNGGGSGRVYHHHHGYGSRWGHDRVVVIDREPAVEATPLPSGPADMPDMGMPDIDMGWD